MTREHYNYTILDYEKELIDSKVPPRERYKKEMFGTDEWIKVDDLRVDISVQRELQDAHVRKIVSKFDPSAFGRLIVTRREDGHYYVTDGQHRLNALREMGLDYAPCVVVGLNTLADEGRNFINVNEQSAKVTTLDKYRIGVSAEVTAWLRVKECLDYISVECGTGEDRVSCVGIIYKIVNSSKLETSRENDMAMMKKTLFLLKKMYGVKEIQNTMVTGMYLFVKTHLFVNEDTTTTEVLSRLSDVNVREIRAKANTLRESNNGKGSISNYIGYLLYVEFNRGLKKSRLPLRIHI